MTTTIESILLFSWFILGGAVDLRKNEGTVENPLWEKKKKQATVRQPETFSLSTIILRTLNIPHIFYISKYFTYNIKEIQNCWLRCSFTKLEYEVWRCVTVALLLADPCL